MDAQTAHYSVQQTVISSYSNAILHQKINNLEKGSDISFVIHQCYTFPSSMLTSYVAVEHHKKRW